MPASRSNTIARIRPRSISMSPTRWRTAAGTEAMPAPTRSKRARPSSNGGRRTPTEAMLRGRRVDTLQCRADRPGAQGAHHARQFLAIAKEDQGGPELDPERADQQPSLAVLHLDVAHVRMRPERRFHQRPRGCAVSAPIGTE